MISATSKLLFYCGWSVTTQQKNVKKKVVSKNKCQSRVGRRWMHRKVYIYDSLQFQAQVPQMVHCTVTTWSGLQHGRRLPGLEPGVGIIQVSVSGTSRLIGRYTRCLDLSHNYGIFHPWEDFKSASFACQAPSAAVQKVGLKTGTCGWVPSEPTEEERLKRGKSGNSSEQPNKIQIRIFIFCVPTRTLTYVQL